MRRWASGLAVLALALAALTRSVVAAPAAPNLVAPSPATIRACLLAAAGLYREPPAVLLVLLDVEGGVLGAVSHNTDGTVDIGPMQMNQIWIAAVAAHWRATERETFLALRDNFCANVEAGAWILRQGLDQAQGDFWGGVGYYHSHDPVYKRDYLHAVLEQALRLEKLAAQAASKEQPPSGQRTAVPALDGRS